MKHLVCTVLILLVSLTIFASPEQKNKKVVEEFYDLAFNKHKPAEAMKLYVGEKYIQHNPFAGDGKEPFISFFSDHYSKHPDAFVDIKRIIVDNEMVVVHVHSRQTKADRGSAVVDMFRLEKGKIVEHWDVVQAIPEKSANGNTMF